MPPPRLSYSEICPKQRTTLTCRYNTLYFTGLLTVSDLVLAFSRHQHTSVDRMFYNEKCFILAYDPHIWTSYIDQKQCMKSKHSPKDFRTCKSARFINHLWRSDQYNVLLQWPSKVASDIGESWKSIFSCVFIMGLKTILFTEVQFMFSTLLGLHSAVHFFIHRFRFFVHLL